MYTDRERDWSGSKRGRGVHEGREERERERGGSFDLTRFCRQVEHSTIAEGADSVGERERGGTATDAG